MLCVAPTFGSAQQVDLIGGIDLGLSFSDRGGNALNSSGLPDEVDRFNALTLDGFATANFGAGLQAQIEGLVEQTDVAETVDGVPADDSATENRQFAVQFGYGMDTWRVGAFLAAGDVSFTADDRDQDAEFTAFGLSGAYHAPDFSLAVQVGRLDATADNLEVLDDFSFGRVTGRYFLNNGQSAFGARVGYGRGLQDGDDVIANDAALWETAFWFEQALSRPVLGGQASLRAGLSNVLLDEQSTSGAVDRVSEVRLELGVRVLFGATTPQDRVRSSAERLPAFGRWHGLAPVVD